MSDNKHAEKLARIEKIVADVDPRFTVSADADGGVQISDSGFPEGFTANDHEVGDYEVAVRKLVRALAEGNYPGSMFVQMMEGSTLTL